MKALVFKNIGSIALENVKEPNIEQATDVIVRITTSAICGTDLHMIRGSMTGMIKGTILGHEAIGIVEQIGSEIRLLKIGDRVIIPSTISCGNCFYCAQEIYAQCDRANPQGANAGTAFYGGPKLSGPFNGLQAEKARIALADTSLIKLPDTVSDDQMILLSDIMPTAYMAVENARVTPEDTVAVFGLGPVGQLVIACLKLEGVKNIFAVDHITDRLNMAEKQGALVINFDKEDPVAALKSLTNGRGPSKVIDAVGVDAQQSHCCSVASQFTEELKKIAPETHPDGSNWKPGNGPSQALRWATDAVAKAGTVSIIGVYPATVDSFPIGQAMDKNLTIRIGNCNHRKYIPKLITWVEQNLFNPLPFITKKVAFEDVIEAYKQFDLKENNWIKVALKI